MNRSMMWNMLAKQGLVLGLLLAVSFIVETRLQLSAMGLASLYGIFFVEWIAVVVHYLLLHRYTKQYAAHFPEKVGFTFGQAYGYVMMLSLFAGVIVALAHVVYLHFIVGYEVYLDQLVNALQRQLAGQEMPATLAATLQQTFNQLQSQPAPSVLATAWGGVFNTLLFGAFFGLIIAGVQSRRPKLFVK